MKIIFLSIILFLFTACDSGDKVALEKKSIPSNSVESAINDSQSEDETISSAEVITEPQNETESLTSTTSETNSQIDEIVNVIDQHELEKINRVLEEKYFVPSMKAMGEVGVNFDLQKTNVYDIDGTPTMYLFAYKRDRGGVILDQAFDIFKIGNFGEQVTRYSGQTPENLGRVHLIYHYQGSPLLLTRRPVAIVSTDTVQKNVSLLKSPWETGLTQLDNTIFEANKITLNGHGQSKDNLCGFVSKQGISGFSYSLEDGSLQTFNKEIPRTESGKLSAAALCEKEGIYLLSTQDDLKQVLFLNIKTQQISTVLEDNEIGSRVLFYQRDQQNFIRVYYPRSETRLKAENKYFVANNSTLTTVNKLPAGSANQFSTLKTYVSSANSTLEQPQIEIMVHDTKNKVLDEDVIFKISNVAYYHPYVTSLKKVKDKLLALVQGNQMYQFSYSNDKFSKLGSPLGYSVNSFTLFDDNLIYMLANGNHLLLWDQLRPWTYGKLESFQLARDSQEHNPRLLKTFTLPELKMLNHVKASASTLLLKGDLIDNNGSILLDYNPENDSINETLQSSSNQNITDVATTTETEITLGSRFNKSGSLFTTEESARLIRVKTDDLSIIDQIIPVPNRRSITQIHLINKELYTFVSDNFIYVYNSNNEEVTQLLRYAGVHIKLSFKTPNEKILAISDGQVLLIDPQKLTTKILFEIDTNIVTRILQASLFDDKLIILDKNRNLHKIHLPFSELNLFENAVSSNN